METGTVLAMLSALGHRTRLEIFRVLVPAGRSGLAAGVIAKRLGLPAATCSFHLKELRNGEAVRCCRNGRSLIYCVNFPAVRSLLGYLTEHCCSEEASDDAPAARS